MTLAEKINQDFVAAMKSKDDALVSVLRMLKAAIQNAQIQSKDDFTDQSVEKIIQKEIKQRKDSVERFSAGGRPELAEKEQFEIKILENYLPEGLSDEELEELVKSSITESEAKSIADFGNVMKVLMPKIAGRADGTKVSELVKKQLNDKN